MLAQSNPTYHTKAFVKTEVGCTECQQKRFRPFKEVLWVFVLVFLAGVNILPFVRIYYLGTITLGSRKNYSEVKR